MDSVLREVKAGEEFAIPVQKYLLDELLALKDNTSHPFLLGFIIVSWKPAGTGRSWSIRVVRKEGDK